MYRPFWKAFKAALMSLGALALLASLLFALGNFYVLGRTQAKIEDEISRCGSEPVGIVFGTSHWTRSGARNPHFEGRMGAAAQLIHLGRVDHLLVSGDNSTRYYNEPVTMWRDLRSRDVRDEDMTLDYAGFSTFDTLARARDVFGVEQALLITQDWHLPRALFIGEALGLEVQGCAAPEHVAAGLWRLKLREWVARVATLGDLYLWEREPHFLGPLEPLQIMPRERDRLRFPPGLFSASDAASGGDTARGSAPDSPSSTPR
ncbi:MAG: ElyC/SanA/YdcF family protein [Halomonas sp.]|uniref:SanA/YdcF family protein n=1 Tax=Halomonas sp. TaxID=1486246 RepID=UPI0028707097|nr:ElyC/SanA/YdcF family protein [Halomonas sp.]MDR9438815.1 ElyC/SanA/YdcF family protein [Halomonas sp.]